MKKLTAILLMIISLIGILPEKVHATSTGYFVVTAYYSPLPNQSAYIMGSYEAELRMNGMGIRGASGKPVFSGMLAAPKNYSFGTKIYLAGLGVGEVADRGGAIVAKGQRGFKHDRIDVWMGHGEEGLRRAMYWGNRTVKGYVTKRNSGVTINTKNHPAPVWATAGLKKISNIYNVGIGKHSPEGTVKKLQELLTSTGFYTGAVDGDYDSVMPIIYQFQLNNNLVSNEYTLGAGYWGEITRSLFLKKYLNGTLKAPKNLKIQETLQTSDIVETTTVGLVEEVTKEVNQEVDIFSKAVSTKAEIAKLQDILIEMGLYEGENDQNYESIRATILKYQLGKKIIQTESDLGAGHFGPSTRKTLQKDYENFHAELERVAQKETEMKARRAELEKKFKELESLAEEKAESKVSHIGILKQGDVSSSVRDLQNIMKELGYFDYKDTAIYGEKTWQSVFDYQVDRGLISKETDQGAGICGPVTKGQMKQDLKISYLEDILFENELSIEELHSHGIAEF